MNSINENQPEKNHEDLNGRDAVNKIRELARRGVNCFFCTSPAIGDTGGTRPMNVRQADAHGNIWFLSASDSTQNRELAVDPSVRMYFQRSPHSDFLALTGHATISTDRVKIEELWEPILKTWFTDGVEDARITVIKVAVDKGYYWDTKHGSAVAYVKILVGAALGKTMDDSIEGKLTL